MKNEDIGAVHLNNAPAGVPVDRQVDNRRELPMATGPPCPASQIYTGFAVLPSHAYVRPKRMARTPISSGSVEKKPVSTSAVGFCLDFTQSRNSRT